MSNKSSGQPPPPPKSIMKPPSTFANRPNGPPTIPLPPPPATSPPLAVKSTITPFNTLPSCKSTHNNGVLRRPRAYTTSSVPDIPQVASPSSSSSSSLGSPPKRTKGTPPCLPDATSKACLSAVILASKSQPSPFCLRVYPIAAQH
jgi:hypothetical protein